MTTEPPLIRLLKASGSKLIPTEWALYPLPELESVEAGGRIICRHSGVRKAFTLDQLVEYVQIREKQIQREKTDPLRYGFEPNIWGVADRERAKLRSKFPVGVIEELNLGGNRASKSERAAKRIMELLVNTAGAMVWCLQSNETSSRQNQQSLLWKFLPPEWKPTESGKLRQGATTKIVYNQAGGFSENTLVLPNGSQCWFKFYSMDVGGIEGAELDGAWADELITPPWIEALRYRLLTRNGVLHMTFTPIKGYTPAVREYLSNAETLEAAPAELLLGPDGKPELVPRVQQPKIEKAIVIYFHTEDNPFGNYPGMVVEQKGKSRESTLMRAYGVPSRGSRVQFPNFKPSVHVVRPSDIPTDGTRIHIVDPCSGRNWFMLWALVDVRDRLFIYREWPCENIYIPGVGWPGPWAQSGARADGDQGPAQMSWGFSINRYKDEIHRLEKPEGTAGEEIFERLMDSRYGATKTMGREVVVTLLEECEDAGLLFEPAPGEHLDEGIQLVNSRLDYRRDQPISATNEPSLFVSKDCQNLIFALQEWTNEDGQHGACKDPIDCLRYLVMSKPCFVTPGSMSGKAGGIYV